MGSCSESTWGVLEANTSLTAQTAWPAYIMYDKWSLKALHLLHCIQLKTSLHAESADKPAISIPLTF